MLTDDFQGLFGSAHSISNTSWRVVPNQQTDRVIAVLTTAVPLRVLGVLALNILSYFCTAEYTDEEHKHISNSSQVSSSLLICTRCYKQLLYLCCVRSPSLRCFHRQQYQHQLAELVSLLHHSAAGHHILTGIIMIGSFLPLQQIESSAVDQTCEEKQRSL